MKKNSISLLESWRTRGYKPRVGRPDAPSRETLIQEFSKLGLDFEIVMEYAAEAFYNAATEAEPQRDSDEPYDGAEDFYLTVFLNEEYDLETEYDLELNGEGVAWVKKGMKSGDYYVPDDPDEIEYNVHDAMLTIYEGKNKVAEYNVKPYIDTSIGS